MSCFACCAWHCSANASLEILGHLFVAVGLCCENIEIPYLGPIKKSKLLALGPIRQLHVGSSLGVEMLLLGSILQVKSTFGHISVVENPVLDKIVKLLHICGSYCEA